MLGESAPPRIMTLGISSMARPTISAESTPIPIVSKGINRIGTTIMEISARRSRRVSFISLR
jgi:hypothetical protein